jgi:hypothetical protein
MSLTPYSEASIRNAAPNRGRLNGVLERSLISALRSAEVAGDVPTPQVVVKTGVTGTAASHIVSSGACRLYAAYVDSPVGANDDLIVRFSDGGATPVRASTQCTQVCTSGVLFLAGADGIGIPFTTDLRVFATKADGSTAPDAGDRPTVTCIIGV